MEKIFITIIGNSERSGNTNLANRFCNNQFNEKECTTFGKSF